MTGKNLVIALPLTQPKYDARTIEEIYENVVRHYTGHAPDLVITHCTGGTEKVLCINEHPSNILQLIKYLVKVSARLTPRLAKCKTLILWGPIFLPVLFLARVSCRETIMILLGNWPEVLYWKTNYIIGPKISNIVKFISELMQNITIKLSTKVVSNAPEIVIKYRRSNIIYRLQPLLTTSECRQEKRKYVTYVGRLDYEKGILRLLKAYILYIKILFNKNREPFTLIIAGEGSFKNLVEKTSKTNKYIIYMGFVNHNILHNIYCNTYILIIPSYTEGMPTVLFEAIKYNIPIIILSKELKQKIKLLKIKNLKTKIIIFNDIEHLAFLLANYT